MTSDCGETRGTGGAPDVFWRYRRDAQPAFDERIFNDDWVSQLASLGNSPSAGRGGSQFLEIGSNKLVRRQYRRGGMARNISENRYVWLGLNRTRAWREFSVLSQLENLELPAPRPYACQVRRFGFYYTATLITHYLPGITLAEKLCHAPLTPMQWQRIGNCISQFHRVGVFHADLNAHNILLCADQNSATDDGGIQVSLIDFDRARIIASSRIHRFKQNLDRLNRSLTKIGSSGPTHFDLPSWQALLAGYNAESS